MAGSGGPGGRLSSSDVCGGVTVGIGQDMERIYPRESPPTIGPESAHVHPCLPRPRWVDRLGFGLSGEVSLTVGELVTARGTERHCIKFGRGARRRRPGARR